MTNPKDKTLVPVEQSDPFLVEIANAAVDANLHDDGSPKYGTAQGYACALEAARLTRLALASSPTPTPVSGEALAREVLAQHVKVPLKDLDFMLSGERDAVVRAMLDFASTQPALPATVADLQRLGQEFDAAEASDLPVK